MTIQNHLNRREASWLASYSNDAKKMLSGPCFVCNGKTDYEIISTEDDVRLIVYGLGNGHGLCRRCFKAMRFLDSVLDNSIRLVWLFAMRALFRRKKHDDKHLHYQGTDMENTKRWST